MRLLYVHYCPKVSCQSFWEINNYVHQGHIKGLEKINKGKKLANAVNLHVGAIFGWNMRCLPVSDYCTERLPDEWTLSLLCRVDSFWRGSESPLHSSCFISTQMIINILFVHMIRLETSELLRSIFRMWRKPVNQREKHLMKTPQCWWTGEHCVLLGNSSMMTVI